MTLKISMRIPPEPTVIDIPASGGTAPRFNIYETGQAYSKASEPAKDAVAENLYKQRIPANKSE